jgi:hypothetical protein
MTSLDIARQGKSAARQIRAQMNAKVLTAGELDRLLRKVEAGYEQLLPSPLPILEAQELPTHKGRFEVIQGDRL